MRRKTDEREQLITDLSTQIARAISVDSDERIGRVQSEQCERIRLYILDLVIRHRARDHHSIGQITAMASELEDYVHNGYRDETP